MPVNRVLWLQPIVGSSVPPWPCPTCRLGILGIKDKTLREEATAETTSAYGEDWFEPEMHRGVFVAMLQCANARCAEAVAVAGESSVVEEPDPEYVKQGWHTVHQPRVFLPAPALITLPEETPTDVVAQVRAAEAQVFAHASAAGNSIRTAVERLLDERGVRKTTINKKRRRVPLSLHSRIEEYQKKDSPNGGQLLAVKWLGNAASHLSLTQDGVFDALDILELVLEDLYSPRRKQLAQLAKRVNRAKGPPKAASKKTPSGA
jgi:hypothetical protein